MQDDHHGSEHLDVVVIGGGQAGLSVGYHLSRQRRSFAILESNPRVGDSWRNRWDSLRLFTPAQYDGIVGLPFPAPRNTFPTKDQMADYLEDYALRFALPVRTGVTVLRLSRRGRSYVVETNRGVLTADHVVVAMASYQTPRIPAFARGLSDGIVQIHSREYRNPSQLQDGPVLIVGAGNSGAEIATELARSHPVLVSGRSTGEVPFRINGYPARLLLPILFRIVFHHILTVRTPMGRKLRARVMSHGGPLIRVKTRDLVATGVQRVGRITGTHDGMPQLEDGRVLDVRNVIWCTGFTGGFSWIDLPVVDSHDEPIHASGIVTSEPGLYFVGLHFLYSFSSTMIHGIARDAKRIANVIGRRLQATDAATDDAAPASQPVSAT